jgi:hypothetical protein
MRDIGEVLNEKELQLEQVRREIEALRVVAPLLEDDSTPPLHSEVDEITWKDGTTGQPVKAWP